MFLIKKRSSKEVREHGSFLSLYCVFDQRTNPVTKEEIEKEANSIPEYMAMPFNRQFFKIIVKGGLAYDNG